jgi:hypothetical protein
MILPSPARSDGGDAIDRRIRYVAEPVSAMRNLTRTIENPKGSAEYRRLRAVCPGRRLRFDLSADLPIIRDYDTIKAGDQFNRRHTQGMSRIEMVGPTPILAELGRFASIGTFCRDSSTPWDLKAP